MMRTLTNALVLFAGVWAMQAQKIQLAETGVHSPETRKIIYTGDSFHSRANEDYPSEFKNDPILFLETKFDIPNFIVLKKTTKKDSYEIIIRCKDGYLHADYDKEGKMVRSYQKLHNVKLPLAVWKELDIENKGWKAVKGKYVASTKNGVLKKAFYSVQLEKGSKKRRVKMNALSLND